MALPSFKNRICPLSCTLCHLSFISCLAFPTQGIISRSCPRRYCLSTPLAEEIKRGEFVELSPEGLLKESYDIIKGLELQKTIFRSNHASNHMPLAGTLPRDKTSLLNALESGIKGNTMLKPEFLRGL